MTGNDYSSAPYGLSRQGLATTFGAVVAQSHASLLGVSCINAIKYLNGLIPDAHSFHKETIPAIHSNSSGVFAVDRYDSNDNRMRRLRRFYNLVIGMCQSGQCRIGALRHGFFYLQIRGAGSRDASKFARLEDVEPTAVMAGVLDRLVDDAWEYDLREYSDINRKKKAPDEYHLSGLICEKAYVLFDDEVDDFMAKKGWR